MVGNNTKRPLTPKQDMFCREYIIDFNATRAAIKAGYSKKTARVTGSENLTKPDIQDRLAILTKESIMRTQVSKDEILLECKRVALADVGGAFNLDGSLKGIHDIPIDIRRAISGFEVIEEYKTDTATGERVISGYLKKVKFWSKDKNVEVLFKHLGMFEIDNSQQKVLEIIHHYDKPPKKKKNEKTNPRLP